MMTCLSELWNALLPVYGRDRDKTKRLCVYVSAVLEQTAGAGQAAAHLQTLHGALTRYSGDGDWQALNGALKRFFGDDDWHTMNAALKRYSGDGDWQALCTAFGQAYQQAEHCALCANCQHCAQHFYAMAAEQKRSVRALPPDLDAYFKAAPRISHYITAARRRKNLSQIQNSLFCLKGFSSSTPAIQTASFEGSCFGGGLYLNIAGKGIVIDPGLDFVTLMHRHGISICDVDAVIITHAHLDHNADALTLSSLHYDYNRYLKQDNQLAALSGINGQSAKPIKWYADADTITQLGTNVTGIVPLSNAVFQPLTVFEGIELSACHSTHIKGNKQTYAIRLKMQAAERTVTVGYTSDTAYFDKLADFCQGCDVLVMNISDIYANDVRGTKPKHSHLGFHGSQQLLAALDPLPSIAILSEFCCTNGDVRTRVTRRLGQALGESISLLPGEVGLCIRLPDCRVCCSRCGRPSDKIKVVAPARAFENIQYVCNECMS